MTIKSATIRMPQKRGYVSRASRRSRSIQGFGSFRISLKNGLLLVLLLLFLGLSFYMSYRVRSVAGNIAEMERRYSELQEENVSLNARLDKMTSKATLMKIGRKLGLRPPAEHQIITLPE